MLRRWSRTALALSLVGGMGLAACALVACAPAAPAATPSAPVPAPAGLPAASPPLSPSSTDATPPAPSPSSVAPPAATAPPAPPAPATPAPPSATRRTDARLQRVLEKFRASESAPGISATILYPDGTGWTGVTGTADVGAGRLVTPDTAFPIASISKTFLAALVLELSGEGAFGLDDPVAPMLPELNLDPAITVRMLLDHTSGLFDFFEHRLIDRALQDEPTVWWSATRALGYREAPHFAPGAGWQYSNTNYVVLGVLAERITGRKLAAELRDRYLDPLELDSAWYQDSEMPRRPLAHGYRLIPTPDGLRPEDLHDGTGVAPFRSVITAAGGAGSLAADSGDVARWARALYGGDAIDDESLSLMLAGVDLTAGYLPRVPYGLGVQAITIDGHRSYGHSGRFLGFRAIMRWLPDEELAIAVLSNQSRADLGPLTVRLVRVVLPDPAPCPCLVPR